MGNLREYLRDPVGLIERGRRLHGPVFGFHLGPKKAVVLLGPERHRFFFHETDRRLSMRETFRWLEPAFGTRFPLTAERSRQRADRPVLQRPLVQPDLQGHADGLIEETERWLDNLGARGEFDLVEAVGALTFHNAVRAFLGEDVRAAHAPQVRALLDALTRGASNHVLRRIRALFPGMGRSRSRRSLHELLAPALEARRAAGGQAPPDYLGALLTTQPHDGAAFSDSEILDIALGVIWAGHATMWGQLSWAIVLALQNPNWLLRLRERLDGADATALAAIPELDWTVREAERMRPPVLVIGRLTMEPYEIDGFQVKKGWQTLISPAAAQRDPALFADPDRYDPTRFGPGREEHLRPYAMIGFGGRHRRCIGEDFARLEIKIALGMLLQRYDLELLTPHPQPLPGPHPNRPRGPLPVRYRRR